MHFSFSVYATLSLICWLILYKYLPETSNKTLAELEYCFVDKKDCGDVQNEDDESQTVLEDFSRKV